MATRSFRRTRRVVIVSGAQLKLYHKRKRGQPAPLSAHIGALARAIVRRARDWHKHDQHPDTKLYALARRNPKVFPPPTSGGNVCSLVRLWSAPAAAAL
jgi:hypothetical protein